MIILHQPPRVWGLPSMSPFCVKLETYLRMTKLEYKVAGASFAKAPKGRVPYVRIDGQVLGDSNLIVDSLKKKSGVDLDARLTREQKALSAAVKSLVEDHLYFASAWLRWSDDHSWVYVRDSLKRYLPPLIGGMILKQIRKQFLHTIAVQGMGQHTRDEIVEFAKRDLTAISDLLGDKHFFHGDEPTMIDATLYGFLIQGLWVPWDNEVKQHALNLKNLNEYCERMKQRYWSDFK